jgi:hypothetical protein
VQVLPGDLGIGDAAVRGGQLLGLPVRVRGIELGRTVDLLVDPRRARILGLEVRCGDEQTRFLPFSTAILADGELLVPSALVLVDEADAGFYRKRTVRLASLRGQPVERDGLAAGPLLDLVADSQGFVTALVVDADGAPANLACNGVLRLGGGILRC